MKSFLQLNNILAVRPFADLVESKRKVLSISACNPDGKIAPQMKQKHKNTVSSE